MQNASQISLTPHVQPVRKVSEISRIFLAENSLRKWSEDKSFLQGRPQFDEHDVATLLSVFKDQLFTPQEARQLERRTKMTATQIKNWSYGKVRQMDKMAGLNFCPSIEEILLQAYIDNHDVIPERTKREELAMQCDTSLKRVTNWYEEYGAIIPKQRDLEDDFPYENLRKVLQYGQNVDIMTCDDRVLEPTVDEVYFVLFLFQLLIYNRTWKNIDLNAN